MSRLHVVTRKLQSGSSVRARRQPNKEVKTERAGPKFRKEAELFYSPVVFMCS